MKRISSEFKFLFNGKRPSCMIEFGFKDLKKPWFKCFLEGSINDIKDIEGIAEIEGTNIRANVIMRASIEFQLDSVVVLTYRTIHER